MTPASAPPGVEPGSLAAWLETALPGFSAPATVSLIPGGRSNLTYLVTDAAGQRVILRRPPLGPLLRSAQDVTREWAMLRAFARTPVPTAQPLAHCADAAVIGAPFFVMGYVDGVTVADPATAAGLSPAARAALADSVTTVLAELHAQDPLAIGLGEFVRAGAYLERQLRRWSRQIKGQELVDASLIAEVRDRLAARMPAGGRTCVVHGDYKLANLRIGPDGGIRAVLDWELAALGDPLADLGWLLASWAQPGDGSAWIVPPPTSAGGFPDGGALAAAYAEKAGVDAGAIGYYVAFAYWRWSCINEGIRARFASGAMGDQPLDLSAVEAQIRWQLCRARELLS